MCACFSSLAYTRPTPPQGTGLHRYQFLVFEQPEDQTLSLSSQEKSSLGNHTDPVMGLATTHFKVIVHPEMRSMGSFTHPQVNPNLPLYHA